MLKIRNSEWYVLRTNLISSGLNPYDADNIIKDHKRILNEHYDKLKLKLDKGEITEQDANQVFKSKFWEMCQKWDC